MSISKTTTNYAKARGLELDLTEVEIVMGITQPVINVYELDSDCEPMFSVNINKDGSYSYRSNVYLPNEIKEDLPAHMAKEEDFRKVLNFVSVEYAKVDPDFSEKLNEIKAAKLSGNKNKVSF